MGKLLAFAFFCFMIWVVLHAADPNKITIDQAAAPSSDNAIHDEIGACLRAEDIIKAHLKAPSTAQFQWCGDVTNMLYMKDKNVEVISGYVDAQNGFGAMLRQQWGVRFNKDGTTKWTLR